MRTTVDIPDALYRDAKVQAALRGIPLRELVEEGLRCVLSMPEQESTPRRVSFPLHASRRPGGLTTTAVHRAEEEGFEEEDVSRGGAL